MDTDDVAISTTHIPVATIASNETQSWLIILLAVAGGVCFIIIVITVACVVAIVLSKQRSNKQAGQTEQPLNDSPAQVQYDRMPSAPSAYGDTSFSALA